MEGLNKILLRLFAAFTILGFFLLMAGLIVGPNEVSGSILNEHLLNDMRTDFLCRSLTSGAIPMFMLFGAGTAVLCVYIYHFHEETPGFRAMCFYFIMAFMGLSVFFLMTSDAIGVIGKEPHVETVTVLDKQISRSHSRHGRSHTRYMVYYSNGFTNQVNWDMYDDIEIGEETYLVVCGETVVRVLDADDYTLVN